MVAIKGHFDGKVFVPDEPVDFRLGQAVILHVEPASTGSIPKDGQPHFLDWVVENLAATTNLPADGSVEHDHYIYGTPKQNPPSSNP